MSSIFSAPTNGRPWLIRTDFGDQAGWEALSVAAAVDLFHEEDPLPEDAFGLVDDPEFEGLTADGLISLEPNPHETYLLVDHLTMTHPEHPVLAVDVRDQPGRSFRLIPAGVSGFAANMLVGNLDFADFADTVGDDGIWRTSGPDRNTPDPPRERRPVAPPGPQRVEDGGPVDVRVSVPEDVFARKIPLRFGQQRPPDQELPQ